MTRTTSLLAGTTLVLALAGCRTDADLGQTATPTVADTARTTTAGTAGTTGTDAEPTTVAPPAVTTEASQPARPTQTEEEPASYPSDPVRYADQLVQAWAARDGDAVARLAVREVELATGTWSTQDMWGEPRDTDLALLDPQFAGLRALTYHQEGVGQLVVTLETAALGGEDAVVGLDYQLVTGTDRVQRVPDSPFNTYADAFHEAIVARDAATLERLGSAEIAATFMAREPGATGGVIVDQGFLSYRDEPLNLLYSYPEADVVADPVLVYTQILELDHDLVLQGADHAVTRLNIVTDARWT